MDDKEEQSEARLEPLSNYAAWRSADRNRFVLSESAKRELYELCIEFNIDVSIDDFEEAIRLFIHRKEVLHSAPKSKARKQLLTSLAKKGADFEKVLDRATKHPEMRFFLRTEMGKIRYLKRLLKEVLNGLDTLNPISRSGRRSSSKPYVILAGDVWKILSSKRISLTNYAPPEEAARKPRAKKVAHGAWAKFLKFALEQANESRDLVTLRRFMKESADLPFRQFFG